MDNTELPEIGLFELSKEDIEKAGQILNVDRNGFFYCRRGMLTVAFNDMTYKMRKGDIFVYLPHSTIFIREMSDDIAGVIGLARFEFVLSAIQAIADTYSYLYFKNNPCMSLDKDGQNRLEDLFTAIGIRSPQCKDPIVYQILQGLMKALCYQIMYEYFSGKPAQSIVTDRQDMIFQKFMASLHKNYTKNRQVTFYARENYLSPRYFSRIVKDKTGRSAREWISAVVIDEAIRLLEDPENSIKDIAFKLGFPNQSFFGRYFLKYHGQTPSAYRITFLADQAASHDA